MNIKYFKFIYYFLFSLAQQLFISTKYLSKIIDFLLLYNVNNIIPYTIILDCD